MSFRSRSLLLALTLNLSVLLAGEARAAITLEFGITPMVQPNSGSLEKEADGSVVATNLAVTSVTSVESAKVVQISKYLDMQTAGATGANFFILDGMVQQYHGTAPTTMTSPSADSKLTALSNGGYLLTMTINNAYVSQAMAANFGGTGGFGWTGVLTLSIAKFDSTLVSDQVTSGDLVLTSPSPTPAPAAVSISAAVVPEPSSILMAGMGLVIVAGRMRSIARSNR